MPSSGSKGDATTNRRIDLGRLEREIRRDVAAHRKHRAEDGMKKRAVHASKDYDEFRNFVSASELKPASSRDVSSLFGGGASGMLATGSSAGNRTKREGGQGAFCGGFDAAIRRRNENAPDRPHRRPSSLSNSKADVPPMTTKGGSRANEKSSRATHDFLAEWRRRCTTPEGALSFLTRTTNDGDAGDDGPLEDRLVLRPGAICREHFAADVDSRALGDVVDALHHLLVCRAERGEEDGAAVVADAKDRGADPGDDGASASGITRELWSSRSRSLEFAHGWLEALPSCGRFELGISFLTPEQRRKLKRICDVLRESDRANAIVASTCLEYDALLK